MPRCLRPGLQLGSGRARSLGFRQVLRGPIPRLHLGSPSPVLLLPRRWLAVRMCVVVHEWTLPMLA